LYGIFFQLNGEEVESIIDPKVPQMMWCLFCHYVASSLSSHNTSRTTHYRKGLVQYTSTHGIILMKKHIEHAMKLTSSNKWQNQSNSYYNSTKEQRKK
jgi:hypothetical protein